MTGGFAFWGTADPPASIQQEGNFYYNVTTGKWRWFHTGAWQDTPGGGGAVSSVSNSDGTLTISPTTGAVVASLNLNSANTWLATQTFPAGSILSGQVAALVSIGAHVFSAYPLALGTDVPHDTPTGIGFSAYPIVNADVATGAAIANTKVVGLANLGTNVFSTYPLAPGVDVPAYPSAPTLTRKTLDTGTSGSGYVTTGMTASLAANTNYVVKFYIYFTLASSTTAANFEIASLPSGAALLFCGGQTGGTGASGYSAASGIITAVNTPIYGSGVFTYADSPSWFVVITLILTVGATPGTLTLNFDSDGTHTATVKAGSWSEASVIA